MVCTRSILDNGIISLQMKNVDEVKIESDYTFKHRFAASCNLIEDLENYDVKKQMDQKLNFNCVWNRWKQHYFVKQVSGVSFCLRTYERSRR
jgi:diaminopimelate epimerase